MLRRITMAFARKFPSSTLQKKRRYRTGRGSGDGVFQKGAVHARLAQLTAGLSTSGESTTVSCAPVQNVSSINLEGKPSDLVETINLREPASRFQPLPNMPYPVACATTLLTKDSFYLFGGISAFGPTSSCFKVYFERDPNCILFDDLANKSPQPGVDPPQRQIKNNIFGNHQQIYSKNATSVNTVRQHVKRRFSALPSRIEYFICLAIFLLALLVLGTFFLFFFTRD